MRGFSLIEVMVAVGVLAVGILGVFACFAFGMRAEELADRKTQATYRARQLVDLIRTRNLPFLGVCPPPTSSGLNDPPGQKRPLNDPPFANDFASDTGFSRSIRIERVSNNPADYAYDMVRVRVVLYWNQKGTDRELELEVLHRRP